MVYAYDEKHNCNLPCLFTAVSLKHALKTLSPVCLQAIMKAFSGEALKEYIPVIREEVRCAVHSWLQSDSCVLVYPEMKRLMFRIAMRILLGFEPEQTKTDELELVEAFKEMINNLFSLPIDVPFSGLYRVSCLSNDTID